MVGGLRHRIDIEQKTTVPDGSGGTTFTWTVYYTCSASVSPMKGSRVLRDNQTNLVGTSEFMIRDNPDIMITQDMRINFKNEYYTLNMPPVVIDEKRRFIQLIATKKAV